MRCLSVRCLTYLKYLIVFNTCRVNAHILCLCLRAPRLVYIAFFFKVFIVHRKTETHYKFQREKKNKTICIISKFIGSNKVFFFLKMKKSFIVQEVFPVLISSESNSQPANS